MAYGGLQKELSLLAGIGALAFWSQKRSKLALMAGAASLGLRILSNSSFSFRNQSVVITGGSRGLGLALAEQLVHQGAWVTLLARDSEELQRASKQLAQLRGVPVLAITCDVTNKNHLRSAFQQVADQFGKVDILINNAGAISAGPFESMTQADFEAQMNLHFYASLKAIQLLLPQFKSQGSGRIINISSIGGQVAIPHMAAYCASKFALTGLSQSLATELSKDGILVTTVYPGLMRTGSPIQAVFKGDSEKEFAWFAVSDSIPGLSMSAERAARQILESVREEQKDVILSVPAKLGTYFHHLMPETFVALMSVMNRWLPQGQSTEAQTGAASQSWLRSQSWSKPFLKILDQSQVRYNETEKYDAAFNLNLPSSGA